ncbi:PEP-CTERM sorting domain-containing protein [Endozoicomonas sp. SM1973]|uniref:PEP-CTERM sorting domain-containing protein n=1 Tax=Spartinivicinus marinus TaxID=2994442 RepID=A0A853I432_9GAMM|nr:PEP-CTERM sorting domain-containing protein [Spartinivicinus marinus]MCX4029350.1 PEP-CTERM sorting domain-containing protein [Spartinivicinus marinus]NYZ64924.1 PEP-CTERM sorting domain-containing protein [Spartinivicinus marinus]
MSKTIFQKSKKALTIAAAVTALLASQSGLAAILSGDYNINANRQGAQTFKWDGGNTATISGRHNNLGYTIQYHNVRVFKHTNNVDWLIASTGRITYNNGYSHTVGRHQYGRAGQNALYLFGNNNTIHNWTRSLPGVDLHSKVTYVPTPKPPVPVPAPASILLMGLGLAGAGLLKKKKK